METSNGAAIPLRGKLSFSSALFGQNLIYGMSVNFIMFAFTDFLGLAPAAVGVLFAVARTWDAVNDPLMGVIADRTRTRWGKFRPWLLFTPLPVGVATIVCFINPGLDPRPTIVYAYVVYIVWGMVYTLNDIPFWALVSAMTRDSGERTRLITMARVFAMVGSVLPTLLIPLLADRLAPGNLARGYGIGATILVVVAVPLMTLAFFGTRERIAASPRKLTIRTTLRVLAVNRPLQIIVIGGLFNAVTIIAQSITIYFVTYNFGDPSLMSVVGGAGVVGVAVGIGLTPLFVKPFGKVKTLIGSTILRVAAALVFFFIGYESFRLSVAFYGLIFAFIGPSIVLQSAMIADSIDYTEWKTGERAEGVTFSFQTFLAKINAAIGGLLGGTLLQFAGYTAGATQTPEALRGIFAILTLSPVVGGVLMIIPFLFYPLRDERHREIVNEIRMRNAT